MVWGEAASCPAGKVRLTHCWDTIGEEMPGFHRISTGLTVVSTQRTGVPAALQRWVLQVECVYTLPVDSPVDLPAAHLLYNTCGLTTLQLFWSLCTPSIETSSCLSLLGYPHDLFPLLRSLITILFHLPPDSELPIEAFQWCSRSSVLLGHALLAASAYRFWECSLS